MTKNVYDVIAYMYYTRLALVTMSIDMADFGINVEGPVLEPFIVDVQLVSIREREPSLPSLSLSQDAVVGDYVEDSLLRTTVPDPIKLRGVGGTTL